MGIRALSDFAQHVHVQVTLGREGCDRILFIRLLRDFFQHDRDLPPVFIQRFVRVDPVVGGLLAKTSFEAFRFPPGAPLNSQMPMAVAVQRCCELKEYVAAGDAMDFLQRLGHILGREVFHAIGGHNVLERRVRERQREYGAMRKPARHAFITTLGNDL